MAASYLGGGGGGVDGGDGAAGLYLPKLDVRTVWPEIVHLECHVGYQFFLSFTA
jgi:hypothetical protein